MSTIHLNMLNGKLLMRQHMHACPALQACFHTGRRSWRASKRGTIPVAAWPQFLPPQLQRQQASAVICTASQQQGTPALPTSFSVQRITGDGSCMFRAVVQGENYAKHGAPLPAAEEYDRALQLRKDVVAELKRCREDIEPFLPGIADDFDDYLVKMSQPGVWGGEPELVMAANVLQRPICVYQPRFGGAPQHIITYGEDKATTPIHVLWSGAHYDLLLPQPSSRL